MIDWFWRALARPLLFLGDAERVHHVSMACLGFLLCLPGLRRLVARWTAPAPELRCERFGTLWAGPVGLAAGFDKDARWHRDLAALGFGAVEVGTLTGRAQPGNERPRLFRLPADRALLNRFGFNNEGAAAAKPRLRPRAPGLVLGVNIGKSKVVPNEEAVEDYLHSFALLWGEADYVVVNVSSPNTQGLRALQDREPLEALLRALQTRNEELAREAGSAPRPILVKIAPDLSDEQIDDVAELAQSCGLAGIIATNTTVAREGLVTPAAEVASLGAGGISGAPLRLRSPRVVARLYSKLEGTLPIVGVGGVMDAEDAWKMIRAGACVVQVYTGFIYGGPGFVRRLHSGIVACAARDGFARWEDAIGVDAARVAA